MRKYSTSETRKKLVRILFSLYCLFLIYAILFKLAFSFDDIVGMVQYFKPTLDRLNLIPFYYERDVGLAFHISEILENILIFVPFGVLLKIQKISNKKIVLFGFLFSFLLELSQLLFRMGNADITDLITNTLGVVLGIAIYVLFTKIFKTKEKADKILTILSLIGLVLLLLFILVLKIGN